MPHSITHGDACFAYFNKIRGIPTCDSGLRKPFTNVVLSFNSSWPPWASQGSFEAAEAH
jgi:hypothetical protein